MTSNLQPLRTGRKTIAALCIGTLVTGVIFALYFRDDPDSTVLFVIPDNYRGIITIEEDGVFPDHDRRNACTYHVPDSGKLRAKSLKPFGRFHFLKAGYRNGIALQQIEGSGPHDISIRYLGAQSRSNTRTIFVSVGTYEEFRTHAAQAGFPL
jgi:hypothetical protein